MRNPRIISRRSYKTRDAMFLEGVIAVSMDAERQTVSDALKEAADWLEEDGYSRDKHLQTETEMNCSTDL